MRSRKLLRREKEAQARVRPPTKQKGKISLLRTEEKLYIDAFEKIRKKQMQEMMRQEQELEGVTFAPKLNESPFPLLPQKPIQERYREVQQYKERMLQNLRDKFQKSPNNTFKPVLDKETEKIVLQRNKGRDVMERIKQEADIIENKKYELVMIENMKIAENCPFQPNLDHYINDEVIYYYYRFYKTARISTISKMILSRGRTSSWRETRRIRRN